MASWLKPAPWPAGPRPETLWRGCTLCCPMWEGAGGRTRNLATGEPLTANATAGWQTSERGPATVYLADGDHFSTNKALSNFITNSSGTMAVLAKPVGTGKVIGASYSGYGLLGEHSAFAGIYQASISGVDRIWLYNWDIGEDRLGIEYTVGQWILIHWVHHGGNFTGYKNGVQAVVGASGNTQTMTGTLRIGEGYSDGDSFPGPIAGAWTWNRGLSPEEIAQHALDPFGMVRMPMPVLEAADEPPPEPPADGSAPTRPRGLNLGLGLGL